MSQTFANLVATYGYALIAATIFVEGLGLPLPGETALVAGAALAAAGKLSIVGVVLAATVGCVAGGSGGYWIGRAGGLPLLERHGRWLRLDQARIERARAFFDRHGIWTILVARFVALLRIVVGIVAGIACMPFARFSIANAIGGLLWSVVFGAVGYAFGANLPALTHYASQAALAVAALIGVVAIVALTSRWLRDNGPRLREDLTGRLLRLRQSRRVHDFSERHQTLWRFVAGRFARGEYLGLHLTIGFIVSVAALWLFGGITEDVVHHDPLTRVDLQLARWFRAHAIQGLDRFASSISLMGSPGAMAILAALVAIVLAARRYWIPLFGWIAAFVGGAALDAALKRVVQRPRPVGAEMFLYGTSFSFPSGHAVGATIGYGMLAYLIVAFALRRSRARVVAVAVTLTLVLAIGLSRLYLGVHYFSDVVAGYAVGVVWLMTCISGVEIALGRRGQYPWQAIASFILMAGGISGCGALPLTRFSRDNTQILESALKPAPVDSSFRGCGAAGSQPDYVLNLRKNRIDTAAKYVAVPFRTLARLPYPRRAVLRFRNQWTRGERREVERYEGVPVTVVGYLAGVKLEIPEPPNCYANDPDRKDYHLWLTARPRESERRSVVVEITPRVRPFHAGWTEPALRALVDSQVRVRVSGWLMLDQMHPEQVNERRLTLWEIHPITRLERQRADSSWANLDSLKF